MAASILDRAFEDFAGQDVDALLAEVDRDVWGGAAAVAGGLPAALDEQAFDASGIKAFSDLVFENAFDAPPFEAVGGAVAITGNFAARDEFVRVEAAGITQFPPEELPPLGFGHLPDPIITASGQVPSEEERQKREQLADEAREAEERATAAAQKATEARKNLRKAKKQNIAQLPAAEKALRAAEEKAAIEEKRRAIKSRTFRTIGSRPKRD